MYVKIKEEENKTSKTSVYKIQARGAINVAVCTGEGFAKL